MLRREATILIMTFYVRRFWNGIFCFPVDITLAKIDYNRGEADLKHRYCILGHCEQMNELPVIGSLCLRTEFWDRHGANIATH